MGTAVAAPQTFEDIEDLYSGSVYPLGAVTDAGCETALCLFSAEWLGRQDVYWLAKAGLTGTCVDLNGAKLTRMQEMYPPGWTFLEADAYAFAQSFVEQKQWDVVTLDPWTGQFDQCAQLIDTWTTLARKVVVLGFGNYRANEPQAPEGWTRTHRIMRSDFRGGVWWLVFERD